MKIIAHMLAVISACVFITASAFADAFADFRTEVQRKSPAAWVCGEIRTLEGRMLFDVSSPKNRFTVVITAHELISQQEWTSRAGRMKKAIDSFISGKTPAKESDHADALLKGMDLPDGRFGNTAVSVSLSESELHYPEIGEEEKEAKSVVKAIFRILKPYDKSVLSNDPRPKTGTNNESR